MDEGFAAYTVIWEGSSIEVEEIVLHFVVKCNVKSSVSAAKSVVYVEVRSAAVSFFWGLGGVLS